MQSAHLQQLFDYDDAYLVQRSCQLEVDLHRLDDLYIRHETPLKQLVLEQRLRAQFGIDTARWLAQGHQSYVRDHMERYRRGVTGQVPLVFSEPSGYRYDGPLSFPGDHSPRFTGGSPCLIRR